MYRILLLLWLFPVIAGAQKPIDYKTPGAVLPAFTLGKPGGGTVNQTGLKAGHPVLLMIFSPECDHCMLTIDSLKMISSRFRSTQLVLVTEKRNKPFMAAFLKKSGVGSLPLFRMLGYDQSQLIPNIYTYQLLPQFNVYDGSHRLVRTFAGRFPLDSLKAYIR